MVECDVAVREPRPYLVLQRRHALLQVQLQPLIGLGQQLVDSLRQTLVVLFVHLLSLTRLKNIVQNISI